MIAILLTDNLEQLRVMYFTSPGELIEFAEDMTEWTAEADWRTLSVDAGDALLQSAAQAIAGDDHFATVVRTHADVLELYRVLKLIQAHCLDVLHDLRRKFRDTPEKKITKKPQKTL